ncbi:sterol desaturase family protein [Chryseosolibacter indicus]|uniref:Sterol desaturase family protein n=1 Tax=Chryseosolibacter indicus TaxID=2782351 RepID=A0ABS5VN05_9BACT|nr:sterol desaturase family protein [Chryseosolibacter indicus]MBT1702823.1 sterol desaturase family protein [Chryseosolibacter indicus]
MTFDSIFGAEKIPFDAVSSLNGEIPNIIVYAAPVMFFFVGLEYLISYLQNRKYYEKSETIGSTLVGIGNVIIGVALKTLLLYLFIFIYNLIPWRMEFKWWTFIPCYIIFDFCSYWAHRVSHHMRFFWATHVAHHSGEHYNLTVSFRLSWVQYIKIIFFIPVALIGFHPIIIFITNQIAVLFQFWVHTEYIRRLHPVIEYVFATPSNHRVHHGSQEKYINKNFGATFIIWDRMFGTFEPEDEQVIYGITHNIDHKHDPIHINFHEYVDILKDIKQAKSFKEKLFYIFGDPEDIANYKKHLNFEFSKVKIEAPQKPVPSIQSEGKVI